MIGAKFESSRDPISGQARRRHRSNRYAMKCQSQTQWSRVDEFCRWPIHVLRNEQGKPKVSEQALDSTGPILVVASNLHELAGEGHPLDRNADRLRHTGSNGEKVPWDVHTMTLDTVQFL